MTAKKVPQGRFSQVLAAIPQGMEKPATVAKISQMTGISVRNVHSIISELVMRYGVPIGGVRSEGHHGVFIATNELERTAAIIPLERNAKQIQRRVRRMKHLSLEPLAKTKK